MSSPWSLLSVSFTPRCSVTWFACGDNRGGWSCGWRYGDTSWLGVQRQTPRWTSRCDCQQHQNSCRPICLHRRSVAHSGVFKIWQRGAWQARRARAYNGRLGAEPPAGSRSRAPGRGSEAPWSWNTFCFWTFNGSRKFAHFSEIWKRRKSQIFALF